MAAEASPKKKRFRAKVRRKRAKNPMNLPLIEFSGEQRVRLAALCGTVYHASYEWNYQDVETGDLFTRVPPRRVLAVEAVTGIPRHAIRPDIYPPQEASRGRA